MPYEIVYGKAEDGGQYKVLAATEEYRGNIEKSFPTIPKLWYPGDTKIIDKPIVFCYTKGEKCKAILSCIKWSPGDYFAQHLIFEEKDDLPTLLPAGPAWLVKRRGFYIDNKQLTTWSNRSEDDKKKTEEYDWKPIIRPSDYCIGSDNKKLEKHRDTIKAIANAWNGQDVQAKYVLLFDPNEFKDADRLDFLYDLYARIEKIKRWNYQFCTFDGQRGGQPTRLAWDIVFVAADDLKTLDFYKNYIEKDLRK